MSRTIFVVLAAFVATVFAQVQVNTPTSVQACLPVQLTWSGGKAPYFVGLIAGGQPSSPILKDFGQQTGNSLTWNVDMPAGSAYTVQIRDSDGQLNYSDQFTIQQSSQTCPTSVGNSTAATSPAATTPAKNGTAATTTPSTNTTTSTPGSKAGSTSNSAPPKTSTSSSVSSSSNTTASSAKTSGASRITSGFAVIVVSVSVACLA